MVGMQPVTTEDIRSCLINMSDDEIRAMSVPGLHETLWGEREFLGWRDVNHRTRGYLVFWVGQELRGLMVRAAQTAMPAGRSALCALCHTHQPAPQVSLFVAPKAGDAGRRGNTVGTYLCADLSCSTIIRITPAPSEAQPDPATAVQHKANGLHQRLEAFSRRVLALDAA
jgi:hypothetical protein